MNKNQTARQLLGDFAMDGRLRNALNRVSLRPDAIQLCVDVVIRYCEPRRRPRVNADGLRLFPSK